MEKILSQRISGYVVITGVIFGVFVLLKFQYAIELLGVLIIIAFIYTGILCAISKYPNSNY